MSFFGPANDPLGFGIAAAPRERTGIACSKCKRKKGGTTLRASGYYKVVNMAGVFPELGCGEEVSEDGDEMSCATCRRKKKPDWTIESPKIVPSQPPSAMVGSYPVINANREGIGMVRVAGF